MATEIGAIYGRIGADDSELQAALKRSEKGLSNFGSQLAAAGKAAAVLGAAAAAAAAAGLTLLVKSSLDAIDAQSKLARQVGGSVASIQALERAGDLAGVSGEALAAAAGKLNRSLGEVAATGKGPAKDALDALGLSAEQLTALPVDERMAVLADRFSELGVSTQKQSFYLRELGIRQTEIISLFEGGGDAIRSARAEIDQFGVSVSDVDARAIEAANDALTSISFALKGVGNQLAVAVAPFLQEIGDRFGRLAKESGGFREAIQTALEVAIKGMGYLADAVQIVALQWRGVAIYIPGLKAIALTALEIVTPAFQAIVGAINLVIRGLNAVTGTKLEQIDISGFVSSVETAAEKARSSFAGDTLDALKDYRDAWNEPWSHTAFDEFVTGVQERSKKMAEDAVAATQAAQANVQTGPTEVTGDEADKIAAEVQQYRDGLQQKMDALNESMMTEGEILEAQYATKHQLLVDALSADLITTQEFQAQMEAVTADHQKRIDDLVKSGQANQEMFRSASMEAQVATVAGDLKNMTASVAKENKTMFEINKAAGIVDAIISTHQGVAKALAAYPPPLSFAMAAVQAAAGFFRVQAIRNTQFGSSAAPSVSGSTPATPVSPVGGGGGQGGGQSGPSQQVIVSGLDPDSIISGASAAALVSKLLDLQRNGANVVLS